MQIEREYILRLIRQIALVLAAVLRLRTRGDVAAALAELHSAYGRLFPPLGGAVARMDAVSLRQVLDDPIQLISLARLLHEEADLMNLEGRPLEAADVEARAREIASEALERLPDPGAIPQIDDLLWFDPLPPVAPDDRT